MFDVLALVLRASNHSRNSSSIDQCFSSNKRRVKKVIFFVPSFSKNEAQHIKKKKKSEGFSCTFNARYSIQCKEGWKAVSPTTRCVTFRLEKEVSLFFP